MEPGLDLTILMPCLNEAETLASCIQKAQQSLDRSRLKGEVLMADNGSTDDSIGRAERLGARVVCVAEKGYGSALRGGIEAAYGRWIVMGDADDSYDFSDIASFIEKLKEGCDLVMGCRMPRGGGRIMPGAMPWKHRWIGNPVLSFIGRLFFKCPTHDFHCGLRAFTKDAYRRMDLRTTGMEFASEMVIKATLGKMRIGEVPITLYKDGRSRPPHLRSWRDGWRHLRFMLLYSPRWLFLMPGFTLVLVGLLGTVVLAGKPVHLLGGVDLNVGTMVVSSMMLLLGVQLMMFSIFTKAYAIADGLLPEDPIFAQWGRVFSLERGILVGSLVSLGGICALGHAWMIWQHAGFGDIPYSENLRRVILAVTLIMLGFQIIFSSFFISILRLQTIRR